MRWFGQSTCFIFVWALAPPVVSQTLSARFATSSRSSIYASWASAENDVATATYQFEEGWGKFWVHANSNAEPEAAVFAAGYLEGYMMKSDIEHVFSNVYADWFASGPAYAVWRSAPMATASAVGAWLDENLAWVRGAAAQGASPFWRELGLVLAQLDGLGAGLRAAGSWLTPADVLLMNADGDLEDLVATLNATGSGRRDRCSALIKLLPDRSDILFGHATWDHYGLMVRSLKVYDFQLRGRPRRAITFSSSPGFLTSLDDFFITSRGIAVIETTNGVKEYGSLRQHISTRSVLTWMRTLVATSLAETGPMWAEFFSAGNSGTYNNQWMVLDFNRFKPGRALAPGTLVVLEQIPGYVEWHDMTEDLELAGYWASYNVPVFPAISNRSGFGAGLHATSPRANIFRQKQRHIADVGDLQQLIRYNDWHRDPLSMSDPCNAISSRCDLNAISSPSWQLEGGIDAKVSNVEMSRAMVFIAQNGPTADQQPAFDWRQVPQHLAPAHLGEPEIFNFRWTSFGPSPPLPAAAVSSLGSRAGTETAAPAIAGALVCSLGLAAALASARAARASRLRQPLLSRAGLA